MAKQQGYNQNTSTQDSNSFNKGMIKDLSDVYMSEGMWLNAINAINNSHQGESGNIGNEMSNKFCSQAPFTIIGLAHITQKRWVLFSTNDIDSEIGIFDEADCSYNEVVNDPCLGFKKANPITGVVKENYDCTYSVYWQDNLNPDRTMNLDDPPYICDPVTTEVEIELFNYTIQREDEVQGTASVTYVNDQGATVTVFLGANDTEIVCAVEDSIVNNNTDVSVIKGASCGTQTVTIDDPNACGEEICTDDLDCDALRLHPLVTQPCVSIRRALGSGQIQNGSYMAVAAYSENGLRLTDYSVPNYPVSLFDNTGIGGGLEVNLTNLDPDYEEYELVIIGIVDQNTVAKKVGYYSTDQTKVTVDLLSDSLETVPLSAIPAKNAIYERSEKMHTVNDYLIRSGVSTQPFINYQQQANNINVRWVAVRYPYTYYRDGGTNVGYMRDEVYPFFIRWIYQTGNYTNSYHIPGRAATPADLAVVSGDNVTAPDQNQAWQVQDTASITDEDNTPSVIVDPEFLGLYKAKGIMGYWESTELYPNEQPEVWGDLCGKPIRHHKMPSNSTIHIHEGNGEFINVLGVQFENITQPLDEDGVPIPGIVGYEILRGSREGNRSIVAKGMFNNMRTFPYDDDGTGNNIKYGLYQNYPYNDLRPDPFLTRRPLFIEDGDAEGTFNNLIDNSLQNDAFALTDYRDNYFSFHSPETAFIKPYIGNGSYIRMYTEERGLARGNFRFPFKHPEHILITDLAFISSIGLGFAVAMVNAIGKSTSQGGITAGVSFFTLVSLDMNAGAGRAAGETAPGVLGDTISGGLFNAAGLAGLIGGIIGFIIQFGYFMGKGIDTALRVIRSFSREQQYALQYNSHCFYDDFVKLANPISRKTADQGVKYIGRGVQKFDDTFRVNNLNRNKYVCVKTDDAVSGIPDVIGADTTRKRLVDMAREGQYNDKKLYDNPTKFGLVEPSAAYYGAIKLDFQNQYGQLRSIQQIPVSPCIKEVPKTSAIGYGVSTSDYIFGGDVYINRYTEKNPYYYFNTWLFDVDNGTEIDYRNYINGPLPRYWASFYKFGADDFRVGLSDLFENQADDLAEYDPGNATDPNDIEDDLSGDKDGFFQKIKNFKQNVSDQGLLDTIFTTPSDFHRLDRRKRVSGWFRVKDSYLYLFYNGIRDFFCESELNMALRGWGEEDREKFYDVYNNSFDDIDYLFRSDKITDPILNKYDLSLSASKLWNQFYSWGLLLPRDYDPEIYSTCFEYFPKRSVYSLQQVDGLKRDNWRNYLALNFKDFSGRVSTIKSLNKVGAVILFEDAEPVLFTGTDTIQTTANTKFTIGDSGLFATNNIKAMVNADDQLAFGTCISSRSAVNTPHGMFYISQDSGKIFQYAGQMVEISKNGMKHWFAENLPSLIREQNPDYTFYDNPIIATGCQTIYDPTYELVYFMKKDYIPLIEGIKYDSEDGIPYTSCGNPNTVRVPKSTQRDDCEPTCPEGAVLSGNECIIDTVGEVELIGGATFTVKAGKSRKNYSQSGLYLFPDITTYSLPVATKTTDTLNEIYQTNGAGPQVTPLIPGLQSPLWGQGTSSTGRLNAAGLDVGNTGIPVCFSVCLDVPETKQYILAIAGDNEAQFYLDGQLIVNIQADAGTFYHVKAFTVWWAFPITLTAGSHIIQMCALNDPGTASAFAGEIYDITLAEFLSNPALTGASGVEADLDPYIFWSTKQMINQQIPDPLNPGQWYCNGQPLQEPPCENEPACGGKEVVDSIPCATCALTASKILVEEGETIILSWNTTGGTSINSNFGLASNEFAGTEAVTVTENTTYWIEVTGPQGTEVCQVDIELKCNCAFTDPDCFEPACWTVSYDPKNKMWISFHDWCPTLTMPSNQHFNTILDNSIWQHNDNYNSYCNYYGVDYPWEIEYPVTTPPAINTLRNIEYVMEMYEFRNDGKDMFHVLDENFDRAILYNSEQISGLLKLNIKGKNTPRANLVNYPANTTGDITGSGAYDILYSKEENKYRFNQFWDIIEDRGEFTGNEEFMFDTLPNGFRKEINEFSVDYNKPFTQRKKFRHYGNRLILRKTVSGSRKMILKLATTKNLLSRL